MLRRACGVRPRGPVRVLAWPIACGQAVAARTSALDFDDGILRVEVPDAGWRSGTAVSGAAIFGGHQSLHWQRRSANRVCGIRGAAMKISEKDVAYVADLAHLELTAEERIRFLRDLNSILEYVDRLNELDTSQVQPMAQMADVQGGDRDALREDILEGLRKSLPHDVALANAPDSDGTFFRVPKVIER